MFLKSKHIKFSYDNVYENKDFIISMTMCISMTMYMKKIIKYGL